jgi:hypothetical protein
MLNPCSGNWADAQALKPRRLERRRVTNKGRAKLAHAVIVGAIKNRQQQSNSDIALRLIGLECEKHRCRLDPACARQRVKDLHDHRLTVVPSQRDVTEQSGVLIVKAIVIVRVIHSAVPRPPRGGRIARRDLGRAQRNKVAALVRIASNLRAILAAHVSLKLMDRRRLWSPHDLGLVME